MQIPDSELSLSFVRSSGPGGQNVNKLATAAQLRFDLAGSVALAAEVKARLRALSGRRLTSEGEILIIARSHRTQEHNRREAEGRLAELIQRALVPPKAAQGHAAHACRARTAPGTEDPAAQDQAPALEARLGRLRPTGAAAAGLG